MPKATILKHNNVWQVRYQLPSGNHCLVSFLYPDGAFAYWIHMETRIVRESKAWAKIYKLNIRLLSLHDMKFIQKLLKTKCVGITKRQYGYLSGIYERQINA